MDANQLLATLGGLGVLAYGIRHVAKIVNTYLDRPDPHPDIIIAPLIEIAVEGDDDVKDAVHAAVQAALESALNE